MSYFKQCTQVRRCYVDYEIIPGTLSVYMIEWWKKKKSISTVKEVDLNLSILKCLGNDENAFFSSNIYNRCCRWVDGVR